MPARIALCAALLTWGCLGPVTAFYPPRPHQPVVPVWVVDHGWHTGLVVPRGAIPAGALPEIADLPHAPYVEVGWGDADFYRSHDPGAGLAIRAAVASGGSVLHLVGHRAPPLHLFPAGDVVELRLSRAGFDALVQFVHRAVARSGERAAALGAGLFGSDDSVFYAARGRYHLLYTCNNWIADALRAAGAPVTPAYAVTAGNLMWQARRAAEAGHGADRRPSL